MKVAITQRLYLHEAYNELRDCLAHDWYTFFEKNNLTPVILPNADVAIEILKQQKPDLLIFSGGNSLYSHDKSDVNFKRDEIERKLLSYALEKKIPILGVCRGAQLYYESKKIQISKIDNHVGRHELIVYDANFPLLNVNSYHNFGVFNLTDEHEIIAKAHDNSIEMSFCEKDNFLALMFHPERLGQEEMVELFRFVKNKLELK